LALNICLKNTSDYQPVVTVLNKPIKQVFQCKTLGVTVDENLSWKSNNESICSKISSGIYALKQIKKFVDIKTFISVYNAFTQPYFSYCCEVRDVFGETQSKRLQKLQNRAARVIGSVPNDVDQQTVLDLLGWKTLKEQRLKTKAKTMFKVAQYSF
jgi:hypothetical protein